MRRVAIVVPWGEALGGAERMLLTLLEGAADARCAFDVVFLQDGPFEEAARTRGARTYVIEAGRLRQARRYGRTVRALRNLVMQLEVELVIAWSPKVQLYLGPALAGLRHRPVLVWWQHGVPEPRSWLDRLATLVPADAIGCSSAASAEAQRRLLPRRKAFVIHPGTPEPGAPPVHQDRDAEEPVVGIVGRLQPWKGQDRFIEALALLDRHGAPVRGLIVGGDAYGLSPEYAQSVRDQVASLDVGRRIEMTGQVEDALPHVQRMDVLVNASEAEPFGITLIEAMSCGVPVVAVDGAGPAEIIENGVSGVLVASGDPADLADGIQRVLESPERWSELAAASRRRYEDRFSSAAMACAFGERMDALILA